VDSAGNLYVADLDNETIRKVTPAGVVTTLAGLPPPVDDVGDVNGGIADGTGSAARFNSPADVAVDRAGNLYVADVNNEDIRKGYPALAIISSAPGFGFNGGQFGFALSGPSGQLVAVDASTDLLNWLPLWTNTLTFPAALTFSDPQSGVHPVRFYRARLP
jgi:hypothetical protein